MALAGTAALGLWNDIAPARAPEYDRWHTREHVPERVAVAGFLGARRYVNRTRATHRYFTLYELEDARALTHPEYLDLLARPTPWSASMRPNFRNVVRAQLQVEASRGPGLGAALAVLGLAATEASPGRAGPDTLLEASPAMAGLDALLEASPRAAGYHVLARAGQQGAPAWAGGGAPARSFDRLVLVEALDRDAATQALAALRAAADMVDVPADYASDVYDLAFVFPGHAAGERMLHRRPGWGSSAC
jgi:hypothetical protein